MVAARTLLYTHGTHSSIWALRGITDQAAVNELIITANSICHQDQSGTGASAGGHAFVGVCVRM